MVGVDNRRKHNSVERRRSLCDAAIALLAEDGPRGLSHLKVDRRAEVPDGTTSFYFRTRTALLHGVADQLVRYDAEAFAAAFKDAPIGDGDVIATRLAKQILSIRDEPQLSRTRARLELSLLARGDPVLSENFAQMGESFRGIVERLVIAAQREHGPLDRALLDEQISVVLSYLGGRILAFASDSAEPLTSDDIVRQLRAVITGVAALRPTGE
ncbi:TetR/AcrR family transcriptional regulator [Mycolicibacterium parafortuitum]|uniref:TetR/AcrR family transcriptional regulator n=1 Tax=Mycolicibacterium parafortuitum TaxID=39692 RepID=UPI003F490B66